MINTIIESISVALNAAFGDRYELHMEEVEQGLEDPYFVISCIYSTNKLLSGKRYFRCNQFCIQYFPEDEAHKNKEYNEVAERLFMCLEYLDVGGNLAMGTKMKYEVIDGILHFFVNYDLFVYKVAESVAVMEKVSSETSVKG